MIRCLNFLFDVSKFNKTQFFSCNYNLLLISVLHKNHIPSIETLRESLIFLLIFDFATVLMILLDCNNLANFFGLQLKVILVQISTHQLPFLSILLSNGLIISYITIKNFYFSLEGLNLFNRIIDCELHLWSAPYYALRLIRLAFFLISHPTIKFIAVSFLILNEFEFNYEFFAKQMFYLS